MVAQVVYCVSGVAMIVAFYGIAAAMVAGGITAMIRGAEYIVLERGWTMVLAGAVIATGGIILAALAELASRLRKIEASLRPDDLIYEAPQEFKQPSAKPQEGEATPGPSSDSVKENLSTVAAAGVAAIAVALSRDKDIQDKTPAQSDIPSWLSNNRLEESNSQAMTENHYTGSDDTVVKDSAQGKEEEPETEYTETTHITDIEVVTSQESFPSPTYGEDIIDIEVEEVKIQDTSETERAQNFILLDESIFTEELPQNPLQENSYIQDPAHIIAENELDHNQTDKKTENPVAIGTYQSGGNTYVMFEDGSIEASTPNGLYRFNSLEELKAFIAAGGEASR
jgi:hypothetical protein